MDNNNNTEKSAENQDVKATEETPKAKEQPSVTKQIEKMRKRIDSEAGKKNEYKDKFEQSQKAVKTLTEKLNDLQGKTTPDKAKKPENPELKKALSENQELKAQLARNEQMKEASKQFSKAGVVVPDDVLSLVVPANADAKQVSKNMTALSSFYDSVVANVKKSFMSAATPRTTGSDEKPFNRKELRKIPDPVKRVQLIKEHINEFKN